MSDTEQTREERSIRKANLADGHTVMRRTEEADGTLRLVYTDGAVAVIQANGAYHWEGAERR